MKRLANALGRQSYVQVRDNHTEYLKQTYPNFGACKNSSASLVPARPRDRGAAETWFKTPFRVVIPRTGVRDVVGCQVRDVSLVRWRWDFGIGSYSLPLSNPEKADTNG